MAPSERTKGGHGTPSRARRRNSLERHGNPTASARPSARHQTPIKFNTLKSARATQSSRPRIPFRATAAALRRPPARSVRSQSQRTRCSADAEASSASAWLGKHSSSLQRRVQCSQAARAAA